MGRKHVLGVLVVGCAAVLLAGCGGGSHGVTRSGSRLRAFSEVEVGRTHVEVAPDGRSATVRLTTRPPTICAVAYGRTAELGRIANDPAMGGTAIADHAVRLTRLTPSRTYRFRLTATDASGRVYQTARPLTFTTTPHAAPAATAGDLARGARIAGKSSQYGAGYEAANAVDGDTTTEWSSAGDGNRAWITVDLRRRVRIRGVAFRTREMADGSAITHTYAVTVDGGRRLGPFRAGDAQAPRGARVDVTGRVVRFSVVSSTGGNTGASEVEVYSNPPTR